MKTIYIETNNVIHPDRYFSITIAFQEALYALTSDKEWKRFTELLRVVMKDELNKNMKGDNNEAEYMCSKTMLSSLYGKNGGDQNENNTI